MFLCACCCYIMTISYFICYIWCYWCYWSLCDTRIILHNMGVILHLDHFMFLGFLAFKCILMLLLIPTLWPYHVLCFLHSAFLVLCVFIVILEFYYIIGELSCFSVFLHSSQYWCCYWYYRFFNIVHSILRIHTDTTEVFLE